LNFELRRPQVKLFNTNLKKRC